MIDSLHGTLIHTQPGVAVVECGGIGFKCMISQNTQRTLPPNGEKVKIFTLLNVREDALDLFGFASRNECGCFKMLTSVTGVGPKAALSILSELSPEQVAMAAASGDSKALTRASGVGPKLAQRIVLELKDKVKKLGAPAGSPLGAAAAVASAAGHAEQAISALGVLGYSPSEAAPVVARFDSSLPVEELIRLSLREFAQNM